MNKLYAIAPFPEDATSFYRSYGILDHLEKLLAGTWRVEKHRKEVNLRSWVDLQSADVLFVQRPATKELVDAMMYFKTVYQRPIWIDYDDLLFEVPDYSQAINFYNSENESFKAMQDALVLADVVTVSTQYLKNYFLANGLPDKVVVVPNAFPDVYINTKRREVIKREKKVMWRGGNTHTGDLDYFQTEINLLIREYSDHDFSFVGIDKHNVYKFLGKKNVTVLKGIDPNYYYLRLQNIGAKVLMVPLAPNQFNLAKSNVAFIEGTWAGMAVVAPNTLEWGKPGVSNYFERGTFYRTVEKCIESDQTKNVELAWQYICDNLLLSNVNNMRVEILKNLVV